MTRWLTIGLGMLIGCTTQTGGSNVMPPQEAPPPEVPSPDAPPQGSAQQPRPLAPHPISKLNRLRIELAEEAFVMEIADDTRSRGRGLSGRARIAPNEGMLFVYPDSRELGFWMNECQTDLDIIYVDHRGRIKSMHRMKAQPPRRAGERPSEYEARLPRYPSVHLVQFALEFAPGTIDRLELRLGDTVELPRAALVKNAT